MISPPYDPDFLTTKSLSSLGREARGSTQIEMPRSPRWHFHSLAANGANRNPLLLAKARFRHSLPGGFQRVVHDRGLQPMAPVLWRDNTRLLVLVIALCFVRAAILAHPVRRVNSP